MIIITLDEAQNNELHDLRMHFLLNFGLKKANLECDKWWAKNHTNGQFPQDVEREGVSTFCLFMNPE